ncbi:3-deoxy-D-manno-octulosonic acid transferase [bacterium]|nr:3-deoxy-D-manno-octulosonic acid transferase [bacterium]
MQIWEILATVFFYITLPFFYLERVIHKKSGGWKKKFGYCDTIPNDKKVIMLHGCSVGEITAVEDLAKKIKQEFPEQFLVITTSTITGQDIAKKKLGEVADYITFFPFDECFSIKRFMQNVHPSVVLIAETEIWPTFAFGCKKRNIPLYIINGRISDLSYWMYRLAKPFFKQVLENYSGIFTQSIEDKDKFISIGVDKENAEFMGNLKFGITKSTAKINISEGNYPILLAGSTHKPENPIVISTYKKLKQDIPSLKLIIAPRHLERVKEIETLAQKAGLTFGNRSKDDKFNEKTDIIILDTLGELKNMYSVIDVAFIGGSFNKTGGHNPLEATIWEKPVLSGPAIFNFKDIYKILTNAGAAKVVSSEEEFYKELKRLFTDKKAYDKAEIACARIFGEQHGAADFVIQKLKSL